MKKEKILLLSAAYPEKKYPYRARFIQDMVRALSRDFEVTLLCPRVHKNTPLREESAGFHLRRFPYFSGGKRLKEYQGLPRFRALSFFVSALWLTLWHWSRAKVVVVHWLLPMGPVGAILSLISPKPLILYVHGSDLRIYAKKNSFFRLLSHWTLRRASVVVVTNEEMKETLKKDFSISARVLPCGVADLFWEWGKKKRSPKKNHLILFVGDLTEPKGGSVFFESAQTLLKIRGDLRFIMVGQGPLIEPFRSVARKKKQERFFSFPGAVPPQEVARLLFLSSLFVLPSFGEGCPVSAMESLAVGVPVIGTDIPGFWQIIEPGKQGELVPVGDSNRLAQTIEKALEKYKNRKVTPPPSVRSMDEWKEIFVGYISAIQIKKENKK